MLILSTIIDRTLKCIAWGTGSRANVYGKSIQQAIQQAFEHAVQHAVEL
jgi:hypothetical protein